MFRALAAAVLALVPLAACGGAGQVNAERAMAPALAEASALKAWTAHRVLADRVLACSHVPGCAQSEADLEVLCGGEPPEGPGWVDDVEHIPGTTPPVVAPEPLATIERAIEWADYPICKPWCDAHKAACHEPEK